MFARRCSASRSLALLASLLTSSTAFAADDWYAVTSDNFTIYSDWPTDRTERVINRFEIFRESALNVLGLPHEPEKQPLLVIVGGFTIYKATSKDAVPSRDFTELELAADDEDHTGTCYSLSTVLIANGVFGDATRTWSARRSCS